ncbi:hypothetical protein [Sandarakinorhabdus rubra]|uniref:hypothetical protein n=1 Tax=Sandarakinorhabdus rubra TaxID=2672568 RepID=UPI0013DB30B1|nr:hypothetical protein [Sandarakinorhabdus rubra]
MAFLDPPDAQARRTRYWIAAAAVLATTSVITLFLIEHRYGYSKPDLKIIYAQSWKADRTREDAIADAKATREAREAKLAEAKAYIATLSGKAKADAQKQLDDYVAGGGFSKDLPYVAAQPSVVGIVRVPAEPPPPEPPIE